MFCFCYGPLPERYKYTLAESDDQLQNMYSDLRLVIRSRLEVRKFIRITQTTNPIELEQCCRRIAPTRASPPNSFRLSRGGLCSDRIGDKTANPYPEAIPRPF